MYIKVDSLALFNHFNQIWIECWLEKGYGLENEHEPADRYIITDVNDQKVGTIEFKPYTLDPQNNINQVYPFYQLESIKQDPNSVIEIDKVAILKQFRGKNLDRLLSLFVLYSEFHQVRYGIALLERVFFRALKNVYKIPLEAVSDKIYYKGDYVIPTVIYPEKIYQNKGEFSWLITQLEGNFY
ncbi:hypothetical protein [Heyndrickxia ginsengihumi]|uniref:GNAT family N-acetyltransferase n=1 Tax=Heyndrickxia ginsengihumi TaxID=363870 RepID=A0A0A6VDH4_9BACI|nr:hypothetical protein [Heyndrickxia ginsengihumi]KHD86285.1 hypothetical protein NG54_03730 [Heyndrickxia ginsengihumi]MBE6183509.1 hypothetical protein [Bacillus sp. (in: firmicutes)]MCM3023210.1 hypothetical protein [Heyndrickxia ginsengihumi]NEY19294.1 hypothetical protein [Heyndrickxia ginsengihumi]